MRATMRGESRREEESSPPLTPSLPTVVAETPMAEREGEGGGG